MDALVGMAAVAPGASRTGLCGIHCPSARCAPLRQQTTALEELALAWRALLEARDRKVELTTPDHLDVASLHHHMAEEAGLTGAVPAY